MTIIIILLIFENHTSNLCPQIIGNIHHLAAVYKVKGHYERK